MKTAFLILGAQRSGTSVMSHMLSKFGVSFGNPKGFLQAEHNPNFFELKWVNQYNDRLINSLGYKYTDFFLPIAQDFDSIRILETAKELPPLIHNEWSDMPCIGIKDPRFSLTFPIWQKALSSQGYIVKVVFVFRCPSGFLQSNQKLLRNWVYWDRARHLRFWLQLNLAAIYLTQDFPTHYVSYDDLMSQPWQTAEQLADFFHLNSSLINEAAAVVDNVHYHHRKFVETGDALVDYYYKLLCSHSLCARDYLNYREQALVVSKPFRLESC
jgi:hypothetical protein